ncbi:MAG TPA: glycosyltransferase family 2 protein [Cyclobacteriaceae bacterium]|jgi:glycosyltransferase involved in cell wall biosynthesis
MAINKLSAVIISLNEERDIGRCLESLQDVCDEIIVLDAYSSDKTADICRAAGVRFLQREWQGYSEAKNYANELATGDLILSIDADEALSPELANSIRALRENARPRTAYAMNRLNQYFGGWVRHGDWYPDRKVRVFRKNEARWEGSIHEKLVFSEATRVVRLKGDLLHYASPTVRHYVAKSWHYAQLVARSDFEQGKRKLWLYHALIKPISLFVRSYFLKLGLLDGHRGLLLAVVAAWERYMRYVVFRRLKKQSRGK